MSVRYRLPVRVAVLVVVVIVAKLLVHGLGWEVLSINPLFSGIVAANVFLMALGGTVAPGFPFDLPGGIGAIALVVDAGGHPLGLYSRTPLGSPAASGP